MAKKKSWTSSSKKKKKKYKKPVIFKHIPIFEHPTHHALVVPESKEREIEGKIQFYLFFVERGKPN